MSSSHTPSKGISVSESDLTKRDIDTPQNATLRNMNKRLRLSDDGEGSQNMRGDDIKELLLTLISQQNKRLDLLEISISEIKTYYSTIESNTTDIKLQNNNIQSTNKDIEKTLDFMSQQIQDFEKKMDKLDIDRKNNQFKILQIEEKIEMLERNSKKMSIEIRKVPKCNGRETKEDLYEIIKNVTKVIGCESSFENITDVYRLPHKGNDSTGSIVTEFVNTLFKEKFLKAAKSYNLQNKNNLLSTSHLGIEGPSSTIYVSESLTPKTKRLLFLARDLAQTEDFQFCWVSNGRVFLRKKQGEKPFFIKNENILLSLKQTSK